MNEDDVLKKYSKVLGVSPQASLSEIKKAYRKKAKTLHPDVNPSHNAQEQFCLLNEAYDFFVSVISYQGKVGVEDWLNNKSKATSRAKQYAEMHYDQFVNSDFYKTSESVHTVFDFFLAVILVLSFFVFPVMAYYFSGKFAVLIVLLLIAATYKGWISVLNTQKQALKDRHIKSAFFHLGRQYKSYLAVGTMVNLLVLVHTFGHAFVFPKFLFGLYGLAVVAGFILSLFIQPILLKMIVRWSVFPTLVSLFFLGNYLFSSEPHDETYAFKYHVEMMGDNQRQTSLLKLQGNKYDQFPGIRFVFNVDKTLGKKHVLYTIENGFFGFQVLKNSSFFDEKNKRYSN